MDSHTAYMDRIPKIEHLDRHTLCGVVCGCGSVSEPPRRRPCGYHAANACSELAVKLAVSTLYLRGSSKRLHFQTVSDRAKFVLALYMVPMLVLYPSAAAVGSFFDH